MVELKDSSDQLVLNELGRRLHQGKNQQWYREKSTEWQKKYLASEKQHEIKQLKITQLEHDLLLARNGLQEQAKQLHEQEVRMSTSGVIALQDRVGTLRQDLHEKQLSIDAKNELIEAQDRKIDALMRDLAASTTRNIDVRRQLEALSASQGAEGDVSRISTHDDESEMSEAITALLNEAIEAHVVEMHVDD